MLTYAEFTRLVAAQIKAERDKWHLGERIIAHRVTALQDLAMSAYETAKRTDPALDYNTFLADCGIEFA